MKIIRICDSLYMEINKDTEEIILRHEKERETGLSGCVVYFDEIKKLIKHLEKFLP